MLAVLAEVEKAAGRNWRSEKSPFGILLFRRQIFYARDDGHGFDIWFNDETALGIVELTGN